MSLGNVTDDNRLNKNYHQVFSYEITGRTYLFQHHNGEATGENDVVIRELSHFGDKLGDTTSTAKWQKYYFSLTPLNARGRIMLYGQSEEGNSWFLQELMPGALGSVLAQGTWGLAYSVMRSFNVGDRCFLLYHNEIEGAQTDLYIQEVHPEGKLGTTTESQKWNRHYSVIVPLEIDSGTYIFGHTKGGNYWFIQEVSTEGKLGSYVDGHWGLFYDEVFAFEREHRHFLYLSSKGSLGSHPVSIREVLPGGKLGEETASETMKYFYTPTATIAPTRSTRRFFYGEYGEDRYYSIRELFPPIP